MTSTPIEDEWQDYVKNVLMMPLTPEQADTARMMFYSGVGCVLGLLRDGTTLEELHEEMDLYLKQRGHRQ